MQIKGAFQPASPQPRSPRGESDILTPAAIPCLEDTLEKSPPVTLPLITRAYRQPLQSLAPSVKDLAVNDRYAFAFRLIDEPYQPGKTGGYSSDEKVYSSSLDPRFPYLWSVPHHADENSSVLVYGFDLGPGKQKDALYPSNDLGPGSTVLNPDLSSAQHYRPLTLQTSTQDITSLDEVDVPTSNTSVLAVLPFETYKEILLKNMGVDPKANLYVGPEKPSSVQFDQAFLHASTTPLVMNHFVDDLLHASPQNRDGRSSAS